MNGGEALGNERNGRIFIFIEVQCADKPAGLVGRLDLNLHIALHVSPCCEFGSFVATRFALFGCVTCGAGRTNPYYTISGMETSKCLSQLTAEYKREDLIVFGEEDPVSGTRTKPARTRRTHHLLESRTSGDVVNNCWDSAYPLEAI